MKPVTCYISYELLKAHGATFALWFGKLLAYSASNGYASAYMTDATAQKDLGINTRTAMRCAQKAVEIGLCSVMKEKHEGKAHRVFVINWDNPLIKDLELPNKGIHDNMSPDNLTRDKLSPDKMSPSYLTNCHVAYLTNCHPNTEYINTEERQNIYSAETEPHTADLFPVTQKPTKPVKAFQIPTDTQPVLKAMTEYVNKYGNTEPRLLKINLPFQAQQFFDYWSERNWKRKGGARMKSLKSSIATWLTNSADRISTSSGYRDPRTITTAEFHELAAQAASNVQQISQGADPFKADNSDLINLINQTVKED